MRKMKTHSRMVEPCEISQTKKPMFNTIENKSYVWTNDSLMHNYNTGEHLQSDPQAPVDTLENIYRQTHRLQWIH